MAITWKKKLRSMRHRRVLPPNENTVTYTWRCWVEATEGESTEWDPFTYAINVQTDLGLPRPGNAVSDWDNTLVDTWADYFRFREVDWVSIDDANSVWDGTFTATSREVFCPEPNILRNDQVSMRRVELYRDTDPATAADAGTAISSTAYADIEGRPRHRDITQVKIELQLIWNTSLVVAGSNGYPNTANANEFVGRRNDADWLGFPLGSVLVDGISVVPDRDEYVRLTYNLLFDPWFHMDQRPELLEDQSPARNATGNADPVNWYQPYSEVFDFTELFGAYEDKWIRDGWQAWDDPGIACATEPAAATAPTDTTQKTSPRYTPAP